jgi:hypothetical protein
MSRARTAGIIGAVVVGAMLSPVGVTAASAVPMTSVTVGGASTPTALSRGVAPSATTGPSSLSHTGASTDGVPIRPIVDWLKRNASSVIPALKNALRSGFNAFKNWWNGLASWIRTGISALAQMSLQELFSQLWHHFFG